MSRELDRERIREALRNGSWERSQYFTAVMKRYDRKVYYPLLKKYKKACRKIGHDVSLVNPFCSVCGKFVRQEGGEKK